MATVVPARSVEEILRAYAVMRVLRPHIVTEEEFIARVERQQAQGYELVMLEDEGRVVTVAGFRVQEMLVLGRVFYVDDLVTAEDARSKGYGKHMLAWLMEEARRRECDSFELDSGMKRPDAHAFYFREGMRISGFHFRRAL